MFKRKIKLLFILAALLALISASSHAQKEQRKGSILSKREIFLTNRQPDRYVNSVFKNNILLTLTYMKGEASSSKKPIDWNTVRKPATYEIRLNSNETFAFHEDVLPQYQGKVVKTTQAHFNYSDGFVTDGYLYGDGVCHLASLMYWAARDAGLTAKAPTAHDFAQIPEIPKEFGVSIFYQPGNSYGNALQNLYITNNFKNPIVFRFDYEKDKLKLAIVKETI